jgi:low affinity Fe/Cu permease
MTAAQQIGPTEGGSSRSAILSRLIRGLGAVVAGEYLAFTAASFVVVWLAVYGISGFPAWMATALQVGAAAVTLVMVFVIQHTQRRLEKATQLKLDELIRASGADDAVAEIEEAEDAELRRERVRRSAAS